MKNVRFVGLDLHAESIAVAEGDGEVRSLAVPSSGRDHKVPDFAD